MTTPDRFPGLREEEAIAISSLIDYEVVVPAGHSILLDDPEVTSTGSLVVPIDASVMIL